MLGIVPPSTGKWICLRGWNAMEKKDFPGKRRIFQALVMLGLCTPRVVQVGWEWGTFKADPGGEVCSGMCPTKICNSPSVEISQLPPSSLPRTAA